MCSPNRTSLHRVNNQVDLEVAVVEALPLLSAAEAEEEGSDAREEAEEMAMEQASENIVCLEFSKLMAIERDTLPRSWGRK